MEEGEEKVTGRTKGESGVQVTPKEEPLYS